MQHRLRHFLTTSFRTSVRITARGFFAGFDPAALGKLFFLAMGLFRVDRGHEASRKTELSPNSFADATRVRELDSPHGIRVGDSDRNGAAGARFVILPQEIQC